LYAPFVFLALLALLCLVAVQKPSQARSQIEIFTSGNLGRRISLLNSYNPKQNQVLNIIPVLNLSI
jgi:hypothetical protein